MTNEQKLKLIGEILQIEEGTTYEIFVTPFAPEKDGTVKYEYDLRNSNEDYLILSETI